MIIAFTAGFTNLPRGFPPKPVDEFSSQIVPLFYREYLQDGACAAALRKAKLALLDKTIPFQDNIRLSLAHPFLWANYVLVHFYR
ncbi:MAG: hypothetical protein KJ808_06700 [Acidobacteria bacterium]|nr:hypothetical protein [Acidobacteriota bacterium]MBU4307410.1 hypothetical protein [Acidobacteriota bacterium]MCG2811600.1 hypothetical protein [Candidatus Aminicenantes bacterium]